MSSPLIMVKLTKDSLTLFNVTYCKNESFVICNGMVDGVCQKKVLLRLSTETEFILPKKFLPLIPVLIFTTKIILPIIPVVGFERSSWIVQLEGELAHPQELPDWW